MFTMISSGEYVDHRNPTMCYTEDQLFCVDTGFLIENWIPGRFGECMMLVSNRAGDECKGVITTFINNSICGSTHCSCALHRGIKLGHIICISKKRVRSVPWFFPSSVAVLTP